MPKYQPQIPLPEALRMPRGGRGWIVEEGPGGTSNRDKRMRVPTARTAEARRIRQHEMAHANWSPGTVPTINGVRPQTLQTVEDARMQRRLEQAGIDLSQAVHEDFARDVGAGARDGSRSAADLARDIFAMSFTGDFEPIRETVRKAAEEEEDDTRASHLREAVRIADFVHKAMRARNMPQFDTTVGIARMAQKLLDALEKLEKEDEEADSGGEGKGQEQEDDDGMPSPAEIAQKAIDAGRHPNLFPEAHDEWGVMEIEEPPRPVTLQGRYMRRTRVAAEEGCVPRNMTRYTTDQRVFHRIARRTGCPTVVLDTSGSMSLSEMMIKKIVEAFPFAKVACYSGWQGKHNKDGTKGGGVLRILADNSRRVNPAYVCRPDDNGENIIDGPVLDWLGKQPEPRVWISDGYVTGRCGKHTPNLLADAAAKCKTQRIKRIKKFEEALRYLKTGKMPKIKDNRGRLAGNRGTDYEYILVSRHKRGRGPRCTERRGAAAPREYAQGIDLEKRAVESRHGLPVVVLRAVLRRQRSTQRRAAGARRGRHQHARLARDASRARRGLAGAGGAGG